MAANIWAPGGNTIAVSTNNSVVVEKFVATAGQVTFTLTSFTYTPGTGSVWVFIDGLRLDTPDDFIESSGSSITLVLAAAVGQNIDVIGLTNIVHTTTTAAEVSIPASGSLVTRTQEEKNHEFWSIEDFGGVADDITDCLSAVINAFAAGVKILHAPANGTYYFSAGFTVPGGCAISGAFMLPGYPAAGTQFRFANPTMRCITLGGSSYLNQTAGLANITVRRTGVPPAGSEGIYIDRLYNTVIHRVFSYNHAYLYSFYSEDTAGISATLDHCFGGAALTAYFKILNWPEVRITGGRYGANGGGDYLADAFFLVLGDDATPTAGLGPNTIIATGTQFNQGVVGPKYFLSFGTILQPVGNTVVWNFVNCYIEGVTTAIFSSGATTPNVGRLIWAAGTINCPTTPLFSINAATNLFEVIISDSHLFVSDITLALATQLNFISIQACDIYGNLSLTGAFNSVAQLVGNTLRGSVTFAGNWGILKVSGTANVPGVLTITATGNVQIDDSSYNAFLGWIPVLTFGGSSVGITYSTQEGIYQRHGRSVDVQFYIALTNKGAAVGVAAITGVIPSPTLAGYSLGGGGATSYQLNMAGLAAAPMILGIGVVGPQINLWQGTAAGMVTVNNTNFTNTSEIGGRVSYVFA